MMAYPFKVGIFALCVEVYDEPLASSGISWGSVMAVSVFFYSPKDFVFGFRDLTDSCLFPSISIWFSSLGGS
uniref:Uncharacterized protein n=1 Tax=Noccaea caerulescens TaxID=107243 RepID=A0A1J3E537_NOCCA